MGTTGEGLRAQRDRQVASRFALVTLAMLAIALWLAPGASAAPPQHNSLPGLDVSDLNHVCGTAVDSNGNLYVASAGESEIYVFDPEHHAKAEALTSIENANQPCALAVDSQGRLYVSQAANGEVVRYEPDAYPLSASPTYGAPLTIDASGKTQGIAVDPLSDRLYVAEGDRIAVYKPDASFAGALGEGELGQATGVAAYTNPTETLYVSVADDEADTLELYSGGGLAELEHRRAVAGVDEDGDPETPEQEFGFGAQGAYLSAEPGSGHLFLYDAANSVVDELEASGQFLDQLKDVRFGDAEPTQVAPYPQRNEVQRLEVKATGGSFTLEFEGEPAVLAVSKAEEKPTAAEIQAALGALPAIGTGNVSVSGAYAALSTGTYGISFTHDLGGRDVPALSADGSGLTGGAETATLTTETPGSGPGRLYVGAGAGADAEALAFTSLVAPGRQPRPAASLTVKNTCGVAVDAYGNRYVAADALIKVYDPAGDEVEVGPEGKGIPAPGKPCDIDVDSEGNVYVLNDNGPFDGDEDVGYYSPSEFPLGDGTEYGGLTIIATPEHPSFSSPQPLTSIGLNLGNDHVFVSQRDQTIEFGTVGEGSPVVNPDFASVAGSRFDLATWQAGGVYLVADPGIVVVDSSGMSVLARINGVGSPGGAYKSSNKFSRIAVDQANGHVIIFTPERGVAEEYEPSGAFVAAFGWFSKNLVKPGSVAIDNSGGANDGYAFVGFDDTAPESFDVSAFGPLEYGAPPGAKTGLASEVGGGQAILSGAVNPVGFEVEACRFEYIAEAAFQQNQAEETPPLEGASSKGCEEDAEAIGAGNEAVEVHAQLTGLDPEGRYRFRLAAENEFGSSQGGVGRFGPSEAQTDPATPVLYREAILRGAADPVGLASTYRFLYGEGEALDRSTPAVELGPEAGPTAVSAPLFELEGSEMMASYSTTTTIQRPSAWPVVRVS